MNKLELEILNQYNLATSLLEKKKYEKAIKEYKKLLEGYPCKEGYLNLGNCYRFLGNERLAVQNFRLAASDTVVFLDGKVGEYPLAYNNIGLYYYATGDTTSAIRWYEKAIALDAGYIDAHWNLSTALLKQACSGIDVERRGLDAYESRFVKQPPVKLHVDVEGIKSWDGSRVRKLVVLAEQGLGDQFMWARYLPLCAKMCDELIVQCDNTLRDVFILAGYKTCFKISEIENVDAAIPMCSLSRAFGILPDGSDWLSGLVSGVELEGDLKIGVVWSGSKTHANDKNRSVSMHRFHKLAKYGHLYSLSPGFKSTKYIRGLRINSWLDTLKYIASMDLVITVDTSVAHAAGAMGVKTWLLQPLRETDFRWGEDSLGSKNIWYPNIQVFRNPDDWSLVFDNVEAELMSM